MSDIKSMEEPSGEEKRSFRSDFDEGQLVNKNFARKILSYFAHFTSKNSEFCVNVFVNIFPPALIVS